MCDNRKDCDDGTDETLGCDLFPEENCKSWYGQKHVKCTIKEEGVQRILCTEPIFKERNSCRNCTNSSKWRCDSGWCIDRNKIQDGIPDCPDDISDEQYAGITYKFAILVTISISGFGLFIVLLYRYLSHWYQVSKLKQWFLISKIMLYATFLK